MSSAVELVCSDCHVQVHDLVLRAAAAPGPAACADCHANVHRPQQQLLLGVAPEGPIAPSSKFLAGITCRSCHVPPPPGTEPSEPIRGQATACAGCHQQEYQRVLDWWLDGLSTRLSATAGYVDRAEDALGAAADSAVELVAEARQMVRLVADAGGQHNLELSDRLFREAVQRVERAYRLAGQTPPAPPDLGRAPHSGLCSYCHYEADQPWNFEAMPEGFHESILRQAR
jgi:hypothetical protein